MLTTTTSKSNVPPLELTRAFCRNLITAHLARVPHLMNYRPSTVAFFSNSTSRCSGLSLPPGSFLLNQSVSSQKNPPPGTEGWAIKLPSIFHPLRQPGCPHPQAECGPISFAPRLLRRVALSGAFPILIIPPFCRCRNERQRRSPTRTYRTHSASGEGLGTADGEPPSRAPNFSLYHGGLRPIVFRTFS